MKKAPDRIAIRNPFLDFFDFVVKKFFFTPKPVRSFYT
jgi:hypothetical protein